MKEIMQKIIATTTATAKVVATNRIGFDVMFFRASLNIAIKKSDE